MWNRSHYEGKQRATKTPVYRSSLTTDSKPINAAKESDAEHKSFADSSKMAEFVVGGSARESTKVCTVKKPKATARISAKYGFRKISGKKQKPKLYYEQHRSKEIAISDYTNIRFVIDSPY